jgi:AAA family ATP:ADP antiporter
VTAAATGRVGRLLQRVIPVEPREVPALLWGFAQMFCLLAGNYVFRPIRDSLGSQRGSVDLKYLYLGTLAATIFTSTAWSAIVARFPARKFVTIAYEFFAATFVLLWALIRFAPDASRQVGFGYAFFIWYSGFNVFVVSVFWSRSADLFTQEQGRRLFPYMAAGASLGAVCGSAITRLLAVRVGTVDLMLFPVALLQVALFCSRRLSAAASALRAGPVVAAEAVRGSLKSGVRGALRSPLVMTIALYVLLATFSGSCVYAMQSDLANAAYPNNDARTSYFATVDLWINVLSLTCELLLASRIIAWIGAGSAMIVLPAVSAIGLSLAGFNPVLAIVAVLEVSRRSVAYGLTTPARETLFTVVGREQKYKAKNIIDTFVWRGGDVAAMWLIAGVLALTTGEKAAAAAKASVIAAVGVPFTILWLLAAWRLRRLHREAALKEAKSLPA